MKKNVLIVNWGIETAFFPLSELVKLKKYDVYLACTGQLPKTIKKLFKKDRLVITNPYEAEILIKDVVGFEKKHNLKFEIVTTFFEMNVYQAAKLAKTLKLKRYLPPRAALKTSVNKAKMRQAVKKSGLSQPRYLSFNKKEIRKAFEFYQKVNCSVVVKPVHSGHSYGSRYLGKDLSFYQFKRKVKQARDELKIEFDEWMAYEKGFEDEYLIEEYVKGKMFSFDGVVRKKGEVEFIGSLEFDLMQLPWLQQVGHITPQASLKKIEVKRVKQYVNNIIKAIELEFCGFHCELKIDKKNKIYLIEIAGRLPGGVVLETYQTVSKQGIIDQFLAIFEEEKINIKKTHQVFQSETCLSGYTDKTFGRIKTIDIAKKRLDASDELVIETAGLGLVFFRKKMDLPRWLWKIKWRSKKLSSHQLLIKRDKIVDNIKIVINSNRLVRWGLIK